MVSERLPVVCVPNPVPGTGCVFRIQIPVDSEDATLYVYEVEGRLVRMVELDPQADVYPEGGTWNPTDLAHRPLLNGVYAWSSWWMVPEWVSAEWSSRGRW